MAPKDPASKPRKTKTRPAKARSVKTRSSDAPGRLSSLSIWSATEPISSAPVLIHNVRADVCVVGAGIAGLTTAYLLAREGKSVVVVEKNKIGQGETSHTSAHLSNEIDASYRKIESLHGEKGAHLTAQSHSSAITRIESIVATEHIDCGFERVDGYLFLGPKDSEKDLHEEFEAAQRAGVEVKELERPPFKLKLGRCLQFARQAQFHPLKYMAGLAKAINQHGGRIFCGTEAKEIKGGKTAEIKTKNKTRISAGAVVVATNTPVNDWVTMHTKTSRLLELCNRRPDSHGFDSEGPLLGYRGSISLRASRANERRPSGVRCFDRWWRRSQDRPSRRRRESVCAP